MPTSRGKQSQVEERLRPRKISRLTLKLSLLGGSRQVHDNDTKWYSFIESFHLCSVAWNRKRHYWFMQQLGKISRVLWSVQFSSSVMSNSLQRHRLQHTRLPCPSPTLGACSNSCPSSIMMCLISGWGRSPGGGHDNPLQDSCLENPMDREA